MPREASRWRWAVTVVFFAYGAMLATWVSRLPLIKHQLHLNSAELSIALLGSPLGLLIAMRLASPLVDRWSTRTVLRWALAVAAATLVLPSVAWSLATLAGALVIFGTAMGVLDIAMNTEAVAIERTFRRSMIGGIHGFFSLGVLAGGGVGAGAAAADLDPSLHFGGAGLLLGLGALTACRWLVAAEPEGAVANDHSAAARRWNLFLVALGAVAFCSFLVEGSVDDWSGIYLHEQQGASLGLAPLGAALCGAGMAVGRLASDLLIDRFGPYAVLWRGATLAALGMVGAVVAPTPGIALAAYSVLGLGIAPVIPIATSLAGHAGATSSTWAISRLTTIGYAGYLVGPPAIGFLADGTSLGAALLLPAALAMAVVPMSVMARRLNSRRESSR